jgi:hypothetical protein
MPMSRNGPVNLRVQNSAEEGVQFSDEDDTGHRIDQHVEETPLDNTDARSTTGAYKPSVILVNSASRASFGNKILTITCYY